MQMQLSVEVGEGEDDGVEDPGQRDQPVQRYVGLGFRCMVRG